MILEGDILTAPLDAEAPLPESVVEVVYLPEQVEHLLPIVRSLANPEISDQQVEIEATSHLVSLCSFLATARCDTDYAVPEHGIVYQVSFTAAADAETFSVSHFILTGPFIHAERVVEEARRVAGLPEDGPAQPRLILALPVVASAGLMAASLLHALRQAAPAAEGVHDGVD